MQDEGAYNINILIRTYSMQSLFDYYADFPHISSSPVALSSSYIFQQQLADRHSKLGSRHLR